jgi:hypothetical protein
VGIHRTFRVRAEEETTRGGADEVAALFVVRPRARARARSCDHGNGLYFFVVLQLPRPVLVATDGTVVSSLGRVCGKGTLDLALFYGDSCMPLKRHYL